MKISFLFWNLRGAQTQTLPARQAALLRSIGRFGSLGVDTLIFAECAIPPEALLAALNADSGGAYYQVYSESRRIRFFSHLPGAPWIDRYADLISDRIAAQEIEIGPPPGILLVAAHLDAPNYLGDDDRAEWAREVAADIRLLERDVGHDRTILVGDLNMNPFDGGLVQTTALHAMMTRDLAISVGRLDARKNYPAFYNPMWSCLGDRRSGPSGALPVGRKPAGTYFYPNTAARSNKFWNLYDQVLLRPPLMNNLSHVEILETDGQELLITQEGRPRGDALSDHLPLFFELDL